MSVIFIARMAKRKKQDKYTRSAQGEACLVRVPGVCSGRLDTTVPAHLNGAGMALKHLNIHIAYACFECHTWLDGGYAKTHTRAERDLLHLEGIIRTQIVMVDKGILVL